MNNLPISIVIPTFNSPSLAECIQAISQQTRRNQIREIIVVGQQDMSDISADENLKFIHVKDRPTSARNRNIGAQNATGEWLCFTDSDCIAEIDWIENLLNMASSTAQIIGGAVRLPENATYWAKCDHLLAFSSIAIELNPYKKVLHYAATLNLIISRKSFMSIGGFDETYQEPAGEDLELCARLRMTGHEILFSPEAIVLHRHPRSHFLAAWQHLFRYGIAFAKFRNQHPMEFWKIWKRLSRIPILGELVCLVWITSRSLFRIMMFLRYINLLPYTPGIFLLDIAYSLGILKETRERKN